MIKYHCKALVIMMKNHHKKKINSKQEKVTIYNCNNYYSNLYYNI